MKIFNHLKYLTLTFLLTCTSLSYAATEDENNIYQFGVEGYHYRYNEIVDNSFFMRDKGPIYGFYISAESKNIFNVLNIMTDLRIAKGTNMKYRSDGTGSATGFKYNTTEMRMTLGYDFNDLIEVYTGLGYRFLQDNSEGKATTTGHTGYLRQSQYLYAPIGVSLTHRVAPTWQLKTKLEYDIFLYGNQYSGIFGREGGIENHQHNGYGARVSLDATKFFRYVDYTIGAFVRFWHIKDSDTAWKMFVEPENKTFEVGLRTGIAF